MTEVKPMRVRRLIFPVLALFCVACAPAAKGFVVATRGAAADCPSNEEFMTSLAAWGEICGHISIWDYSVNFANYIAHFPNLFSIQRDIRTYAEHGVISVFDEGAWNSRCGDFDELRCYLISKMLWDPSMTDEAWDAEMNDFLKYYYGDGWVYIRRYMDIIRDASSQISSSSACLLRLSSHSSAASSEASSPSAVIRRRSATETQPSLPAALRRGAMEKPIVVADIRLSAVPDSRMRACSPGLSVCSIIPRPM